MADKKGITIIRRKKGHGGHGHHGGAWKVAYADFVTAMMAFFLVMWLLGADEETKAIIAHYFNNPSTPWKAGKDPKSQTTVPLGESTGPGASLLNGRDGGIPEDLVARPAYPPPPELEVNKELAELVNETLPGKVFAFDIEVDSIRFSVSETQLFEPGTSRVSESGKLILGKLGPLIRSYEGQLELQGHSDIHNSYESTLAKAVAVMKHLIQNRFVNEEQVTPTGLGHKKPLADGQTEESSDRNRRLEFILSKKTK